MTTPAKKPSPLLPVLNVVVSTAGMGVLLAGSFLLTPAMLAGLGESKNGDWQTVIGFVGWMKLLDLGTSTVTVKYGAGALERGDDEDLRKVLSTTSMIFMVVSAIALFCTGILAWRIPLFLPQFNDRLAIVMVGSAFAVDLLSRTFAASLRLRSLFFVYDGIEIVSFLVFRVGLILYFSYHGGLSFRILAGLVFCDSLARNGLVSLLALKLAPYVRKANPFRPSREMISKWIAMAVPMIVLQLADVVRFQVDAFVIEKFMDEGGKSVTIFSVGTRLPSIAFQTIGVIGAVLVPRFSGLAETGNKDELKGLLRRANLATGLVASFILVSIGVVGPQFLALWLKRPWVATSGQILLLMLPAYFVALLTGPAAGVLVGSGKVRPLTAITVAEATLNLGLSIALVKPFGIFGVAIGTIVPMILVRGIVFPILFGRETGIGPAEYYKTYARPVFLGLVYLALVGGLVFVPLTSYARFLGVAVVCAVVFFTLLLAVVPEARAAVPKVLAKLPGRRKRTVSE